MSKIKFLVGAGIVILAFGLVSCGTKETTPLPGGAESTIVIVVAEEPPSFNPVITDAGYDSLVMELFMLGLTDLDADGNVFAELAAELPSVDNARRTESPSSRAAL